MTPRKPKAKAPEAPAPDVEPSIDTEPTPDQTASEAAVFTVLNSSGQPVREYTGESAEENAKEYAKKIGGSVK